MTLLMQPRHPERFSQSSSFGRAASANIDSETFNRLHAASKSEKETIKSDAHRPIWVIPALGLCALFISLIVFAISRPQNTADAQSRITVAVPEDRTEFIKDVTIPDGTAIPVNTEFVKTWRVRTRLLISP